MALALPIEQDETQLDLEPTPPHLSSPASNPTLTNSPPTLRTELHLSIPETGVNLEESSPQQPFIPDDQEAQQAEFALYKPKGRYDFPPTLKEVQDALRDLADLLKPPRETIDHRRVRTLPCCLPEQVQARLEMMRQFASLYVRRVCGKPTKAHWMKSFMDVGLMNAKPVDLGCIRTGESRGKQLRHWLRDFIKDRDNIPHFEGHSHAHSMLDDEDLVSELNTHLMSKGKYVQAHDLVEYIGKPELLERLGRTKTITVRTAQRWMHELGWRWTVKFRGLYADGHERTDVVRYRNDVFLPQIQALRLLSRKWERNLMEESDDSPLHPVVRWYHDESIFYAHDRRESQWVHKSQSAQPYTKGEGYSLMVADFISADHGWLRSRDGQRSARRLFRPGKNREGYFDSTDVIAQVHNAISLVKEEYPEERHIFIFDNAPTSKDLKVPSLPSG
jgi:hypothetical protein